MEQKTVVVVSREQWDVFQRSGTDMSHFTTAERQLLGLRPHTSAESTRIFLHTDWTRRL